jgi:D-alanyl-D-alanine carboxypeptidase (penicillin-binding protein 5/6)
MRYVRIALFFSFATLFLWYPGNSDLLHTYAYNADLFVPIEQKVTHLSTSPYPYVTNGTAPAITAQSAYIVDRTTLTPVFARNEHMSMYPASTTKMISALVVFDHLKPTQVISVPQVHEEGQVMGLVTGERITVENLLYGMLVYSGNDAAYAFADYMVYNHFIDLMNQKAKQLQMNDTHFTNPAGLHNPAHVSTAYDLSLAARELLNNEYLAKMVHTKQITVSDEAFTHFHQLSNVNQLLGVIPGVGGLKTGYTEEAGENLVTLYRRPDGHELIVVVLKSEDRFIDTKAIVDWINSSVAYKTPTY